MTNSFFCSIGLHKWSKWKYHNIYFTSNVIDWEKNCKRCGRIKRVTEYKRQ